MSSPEPAPGSKPPLKEQLKKLFVEYGYAAFAVYFSIFFGFMLLGFASAVRLGASVENTASMASTLFAVWLAAKVTQPARVLATIALTPVVVKIAHRIKGTHAP